MILDVSAEVGHLIGLEPVAELPSGTASLDAIKETVGEKTEVVYEKNPSPDTFTGQDFSFATVAVGESPYVEERCVKCEYNGTELIISIADRVPTLAILISGRPLTLKPKLLEKIDGLVAAWLPGSEGGGITNVVFGDYEFRGRLPVTWFKSVEQLPMHVGENSYDPLFPLRFPEAKQKMLLPSMDTHNNFANSRPVGGTTCDTNEGVVTSINCVHMDWKIALVQSLEDQCL
ncbi:unnamed protein product [Camellia sinensis]